MSNKTPQSEEFLRKPVRQRLETNLEEADRLRDLSEGLDCLKNIIDGERERQVASKLLTLKLLYAGYFGAKGRSTKFAGNPCAIREALKFCRENRIAPPDWTLKYLYDLMAGEARPPSPNDERRWSNLMKLLDLAAEWDQKSQDGMSDADIERDFRKKGISETPIQYAKAFVNPQAKQVVFDFAKSLNLESVNLNKLSKERLNELQKAVG